MSVQNMPYRQDYTAVSVQATSTAQRLTTLIETMLGLSAGQLATLYREMTIQIDPETSSTLSCRFGNQNVGSTLNGVVQKGFTLGPTGGISDTVRGPLNVVYFGSMWVQAVTSTVTLNVTLWSL